MGPVIEDDAEAIQHEGVEWIDSLNVTLEGGNVDIKGEAENVDNEDPGRR